MKLFFVEEEGFTSCVPQHPHLTIKPENYLGNFRAFAFYPFTRG